jgi:hypothetical protein
MIEDLDYAKVKNGQEMTIRLFSPPEPDYAGKFKHFMRYLGNENTRSVGSRADGKYAAVAERFHLTSKNIKRQGRAAYFAWFPDSKPYKIIK